MPHLPQAVKGENSIDFSMLPTLQKYILREMGRSFLLASVGLTFVLSTCGGVVSLIPLESISTGQTLWMLAFVIPISAAFTLPIAALFSATITYGRMAADNEFTAVRSSGINTLILFVPCLVLSLLSAIITFLLFNFLIPALMGEIRHLTRASVKAIMLESLTGGGSIEFKNVRIHADHLKSIQTADQNDDFVLLEGVAFIEFESQDQLGSKDNFSAGGTGTQEISAFGMADSAVIKFALGDELSTIEASLADISAFDPGASPVPRSENLLFGPYELLAPSKLKPRRLSLPRLLEYRKNPEEVFPKVIDKLFQTRTIILAKLTFDHLAECFASQRGRCHLNFEGGGLDIKCANMSIDVNRDGGAFWLAMEDVEVTEQTGEKVDVYTAETARLELQHEQGSAPRLLLELTGRVTVQDGFDATQQSELKRRGFDGLGVPQVVLDRFGSPEFANERLWNKKLDFNMGPEIKRQRSRLRKERSKYLHQIYAEIHARTVFSISVFVLAVLGAALGIIYRGGQVLVAFGISFLPTLFVIMMTILGKSIAKGEGSLVVGLSIMWSGLIAVIVLDYVIFKRYLPR